jgi:beta-N-acetylhexosaminidase
MTAARRAAELLVVGIPGHALGREAERLLARLRPGGVILLPRNVESAPQLRELVAALRRTVPGALLYLDAEGGRVDRLRPLLGAAPGGAAMAARAPRFAARVGRWIGHGLRCFDFDVDLAPVVDLDRGRRDNALDGRYLGASPAAVTARARAFLAGLAAAGVGGCVKHFPGLGGAGEDTHLAGSEVGLDAGELAADLAPFAAVAPLAGAVMAGHASYPAFDPQRRPATLSPPIAGDLLRHRLGFDGLLLSDDLDMQALAPWGRPADRAEAALAAGCDLLCLCHSLAAAPEVAVRLEGPALAERRREALQRLDRYRRRLAALPRHRRTFTAATVRRRLAELRGEGEA